MEINKSQKLLLEYLKETKDSGPSLLFMYKLYWRCNLALIVILLFLIAADIAWGISSQSILFYGVIVGAFIRDLGVKRKQKINWPVQVEITNWDKVDSLLNK